MNGLAIFFKFYFSDDVKSIDSPECIRILRQVFKAVEYIHSQNLIHRDLKVITSYMNHQNVIFI